ncbi:hypothetical protein A4G19_13840 [Pasteurellaceae bacterium Macca]|nr:hypothetical protein [Pasteurellaceae bacterium Macca]MCK3656760.1 hypothetical protein [Pasteurellaceae bacterium Macca]
MKTTEETIESLVADLPKIRQLKKEGCILHIERLLDVLEYHEIIELLDKVHYQRFVKGEIANHHTEIQAQQMIGAF